MNKSGTLTGIDEALSLNSNQSLENHRQYLNCGLTDLLSMLGLTKNFVRAKGCYIWDSDNRKYIDFLAGYGAVSLGHNHPRVIEAVKKADNLPNILQVALGILPGVLAKNLAMITPGELQRSFFGNSGAEAVEGALKIARAATKRTGIIYTDNSFHGKTFGALSVTGREKYQKPFLPLLPETRSVPFGDTSALEKALRDKKAAAFIVEPIQGEGGIVVPPKGYLAEVRKLCSQYEILLIIDEIQTGLGRTGRMFACEHEGIAPDIMCLAKSLGGGVVPISVFISTDDVWQKAFGGAQKCTLHTSTFGGNTRACAAGVAALQVIVEEKLAESAVEKGAYLMAKLNSLKEKHGVIKEVRGMGLMIGVEFTEPTSGVLKALSLGILNSLSKEYLAAMVAGELANKHGIITAYTLNNPNVIRIEPPLNISREDIDVMVLGLDEVLGRFKSFIGAALANASKMFESFIKTKG